MKRSEIPLLFSQLSIHLRLISTQKNDDWATKRRLFPHHLGCGIMICVTPICWSFFRMESACTCHKHDLTGHNTDDDSPTTPLCNIRNAIVETLCGRSYLIKIMWRSVVVWDLKEQSFNFFTTISKQQLNGIVHPTMKTLSSFTHLIKNMYGFLLSLNKKQNKTYWT